ncbi:MAG: glycosyltransferase [Candidatus Altiarchaeota archaeon]
MQGKVSFIIPIGPGLRPDVCVASLRKLDFPRELMEVVVAEGKSPSEQRNKAAAEASGDIVYFLDDDVVVEPDLLEHTLHYYDDERVAVVGGPMVTPESDPLLARCFGYTMESAIGAGSMRYRFRPIGGVRDADETHLVLCNLSCRRDYYLKEGGLHADLYPNEENEFFNRMASRGYRMIYDPKALVHHSRAGTISKIIRKNIGYGRGRMEQILMQPSCFRPLFLMPTGFAAYLLSIIPVILSTGWFFYILPLLLYLTLTGLTSLKFALDRREFMVFPAMWLLYPIIHVSYGLGFVYGLFRKFMGCRTAGGSGIKISRVGL